MVAAGGLIAWLPSRRGRTEPTVAADRGGAATTGNHTTTVEGKTGGSIINAPVTNSTITAGLSADEVARLMRAPQAERDNLVRAAAEAQRDLGSTVTLVQAFLRTILDRDVPPDQFAATLMDLAASWKAAGERIEAKRGAANLFPEVEALRQQAKAAYDAERLDEVEALLAEIDRRETAAMAELTNLLAAQQASNVTTKKGRIDVALSRGDAEGAARLIAEIVALETPEPARFDALRARWREWYERGRDRGLSLDLRVAIALARATVAMARDADQRGGGLNDLAAALGTLGVQENSSDILRESVAACYAALEQCTRDRMPIDWATTQNNLGNALGVLGECTNDIATLQKAQQAYELSLSERTREDFPQCWASTTNNLAGVLHIIGEKRNCSKTVGKAIAAYEDVLKERKRDIDPLLWAETQYNLGNAHLSLALLEKKIDTLFAAKICYEFARDVFDRERAPMKWAMNHGNLGIVLSILAERTAEQRFATQAIETIEAALAVFREAGAPFYIGTAERALAAARALHARLSGG